LISRAVERAGVPTAYVTAPPEEAERIARELVEMRLAACVNRVPCRSTYRWEGEIETEEEAVLLAKTTADAYPDLAEYVTETHPYDTVCVERFDESEVETDFGDWVAGAVGVGPE
jgi:periplasmic divalent cation tolerance protein